MTGAADPAQATSEFLALQEAVAGRYSLVRELGRGGSAVVFLAREVALERLVAIKLLRRELVADPGARARFLDEARTAARLQHPHVVPVHAVEEEGGWVFLVMAYVEGESLGDRVRRAGPLSPAAVRQVVQDIAWALAAAHEAGILHLDVKPDNILLERETGRALLTDFGIARLRGGSEGDGRTIAVGTPRYMSPEQLEGGEVEDRSDLYSLGVTAFYALTAGWPDGTTQGREREPVASLEQAGVAPPALALAIERCLSTDPGRRPSSAAALATDLAEVEALPFQLPPAGRRLVRQLRQVVLVAVGAIPLLALWPRPGFLVAAGLTLPVLASLAKSARALVRSGYDASLLRDVLAEEVRGLFSHRAGADASSWERVRRVLIRSGPVLTVLGALAVGGAWSLRPDLPVEGAAAAVVLLGALLLGAGPAEPAGSPLRHLDWAERMLTGRFGRALFRIAGVGLKVPQRRQADAPRPTEAMLARASEALFQELPGEFRRRFPELPEVVRHLEDEVDALRRKERKLVGALSRVDLPEGDGRAAERADLRRELEASRAEVDARLRETVAALEHLRLVLARLASDTTAVSVLELDAEVARAREAGRAPGPPTDTPPTYGQGRGTTG